MNITTLIFDFDGVMSGYHAPSRLDALASMTGLGSSEVFQRIWETGFEDEAEAATDALLDRLKVDGASAPAIWQLEKQVDSWGNEIIYLYEKKENWSYLTQIVVLKIKHHMSLLWSLGSKSILFILQTCRSYGA